jgi:hypothetical protein
MLTQSSGNTPEPSGKPGKPFHKSGKSSGESGKWLWKALFWLRLALQRLGKQLLRRILPSGGGAHLRLGCARLGGGHQRGGDLFVEIEQVFDAGAVARERFGPVTAIHGVVEDLMRL